MKGIRHTQSTQLICIRVYQCQESSLESLQSIKAFLTKLKWTPTPHSFSTKEDVLFPICLIRNQIKSRYEITQRSILKLKVKSNSQFPIIFYCAEHV